MRHAVLLALCALLYATHVHAQGFSVEEQINRTGFLSITCDQENDAYVFAVNNNIALAMSFRVDLHCKNSDARNSIQLATLAPFSRTPRDITIKPAAGTVRNQECSLSLIGKDVYQQGSSDPDADYKYSERTRLCGRSIFDGAFDDDDDGCDYWFDCIGTRNWWHNGFVYVLGHVALFVGAFMLVLVIGANRQFKINDVADNYNVAGKNPRELFLRIRDNLEGMVENDLQRERVISTLVRDNNPAASMRGGAAFSDQKGGAGISDDMRSSLRFRLTGGASMDNLVDREGFILRHGCSEEYITKAGTAYMDLLFSRETSTAGSGGRLDFASMHGGAGFADPIGYKDGSVEPAMDDIFVDNRIEVDLPSDAVLHTPLTHGGMNVAETSAQPSASTRRIGGGIVPSDDMKPMQTSTDVAAMSARNSVRSSGYTAVSTLEPQFANAGGVV